MSEGCHIKEVMRAIPTLQWGAGTCAQAEQRVGGTQDHWPKKSAEFLLHMLKNAANSAEIKGLDVDSLVIKYIQVNKAPRMPLYLHSS